MTEKLNKTIFYSSATLTKVYYTDGWYRTKRKLKESLSYLRYPENQQPSAITGPARYRSLNWQKDVHMISQLL